MSTIIKNKLYGGEVEITFNSGLHRYTKFNPVTKQSEVVPSVTTLLGVLDKPALVGWAANMAVDYVFGNESVGLPPCIIAGSSYDELELSKIAAEARIAHRKKKIEASDIGSHVHKWVERYINAQLKKEEMPLPPVNEQIREATERFVAWAEQHQVKFLASEQMVYSRRYNFVGTFDFICTMQGKPDLYMGDLKTSNGIWTEYLLQTAAYRYARSEEYPHENYVGQLIVRVGKESGELDFAVIRDTLAYQTMFRGFLAVMGAFKTMEFLKTYKWEKE